jgi:hypothetical protein
MAGFSVSAWLSLLALSFDYYGACTPGWFASSVANKSQM